MGALTAGLLIAVFIFWGWDSLVTVNEETEDSETTPGKAAVMSTLILVGIYVIVATAAIAFGGVDRLADDQSGDVLGLLAGERLRVDAARQGRDRRGAHLRGGVDADDDPPDVAHGAVDGARRRPPRRRSATSMSAT